MKAQHNSPSIVQFSPVTFSFKSLRTSSTIKAGIKSRRPSSSPGQDPGIFCAIRAISSTADATKRLS